MSQNFETPDFIKKLKEKDKIALDLFTQYYNTPLLKCCYGMGMDTETARECVQNTWLSFLDAVQNFEGRSQVKTFLFGVLYNKSHEFFRKYKRSLDFDSIDDTLESMFDTNGHWTKKLPDPNKLFESKEFLKQLEDCLEHLPLNQKMAFSLREIEELDTEEICKALEVTENNLNVVIYRAKNRLKLCLEEKNK